MTFFLVLALVFGAPASASFELKHVASLKGILRDPTGATLPNAKLELRRGRTVVRTVSTQSDGIYDFGQLLPGKYTIRDLNNAWCAPSVVCAENCQLVSKSNACWVTPIN